MNGISGGLMQRGDVNEYKTSVYWGRCADWRWHNREIACITLKQKKKWARFFGGIRRIYPSGIHFSKPQMFWYFCILTFPFLSKVCEMQLKLQIDWSAWWQRGLSPAWDFSWMSYSVTSLYKGKNFSNSFLRGTWMTDPNFMAVHPSTNTSWWH